ncbi:MAG: hypothetical protein MI861_19880 [Pirellulales bacterium]|nr:hypothetical protein [Pirellulales bacterium]
MSGNCYWIATSSGEGKTLNWVQYGNCDSGCTCEGMPTNPPTIPGEFVNGVCVLADGPQTTQTAASVHFNVFDDPILCLLQKDSASPAVEAFRFGTLPLLSPQQRQKLDSMKQRLPQNPYVVEGVEYSVYAVTIDSLNQSIAFSLIAR